MSRTVCGICWCPYDDDTGACGCEPAPKEQHTFTLREAGQQALEALEDMLGWQSLAPQTIQEIAKGRAAALRAALAEPEYPQGQASTDVGVPVYVVKKAEPVQEPVAWRWRMRNLTDAPGFVQPWTVTTYYPREQANEIEPLYTSPPQRKPLTEEEIDELSRTMVKGDRSVNWLCRAIERAHGIT